MVIERGDMAGPSSWFALCVASARLLVRGLALLLLVAAPVAGCQHRYVVEDAVLRQIARMEPERREGWVVPAKRSDGTRTLIRADSIAFDGPLPSTTGPKRVAVNHGSVSLGMGVMLDVVGAIMIGGGAAVLHGSNSGDDTGLSTIAAFPLLSFGVGHLASGVVLSCVGALQHSEEVDVETPVVVAPAADSSAP